MENYYPSPIDEQKEGIPTELVINKISEDIICPICFELVLDFVVCAQCGKLLCKKCSKNSIEKVGDFCPLCRKSPFICGYREAFKHLFINILIKCPNKLCDGIILYSEYITHIEECKFRKYHCANEGCDYENILKNKKDMEIHSNECIHRLVSCNFCAEKMKRMELKDHISSKCTQIVKCNYCNKRMPKEYFLNVHNNGNDNDVRCLKNRVSYYYNQSAGYLNQFQKYKFYSFIEIENLKKEHKEEINKYKEVINKLQEECETLSSENEQLNKEIFEWDNNFKNLHNSFLNKKRKRKNQNNK